MKYLLFTITVLFSATIYSQSKQDWVWYGTKSATLKVKGVDENTGKPVKTEFLKLNGDTLTILDKSIRFIVVDGVTYEILRMKANTSDKEGAVILGATYTPNGTLFRPYVN